MMWHNLLNPLDMEIKPYFIYGGGISLPHVFAKQNQLIRNDSIKMEALQWMTEKASLKFSQDI